MVTTQWYDILGVLGVTYAGFSALLVLVVHLEQWLARPDPPTLTSAEEQALNEQDRSGIEHRVPHLSVHARSPGLPGAKAPGLGVDSPAAPVSGHLFTLLPPHPGQQRALM